jgi:hypothetical protein
MLIDWLTPRGSRRADRANARMFQWDRPTTFHEWVGR